jgi:hypothetical protein
MTGKKIKNLNEFVEKMDNLKKQEKMDLSSDQDLTFAIMNLISIEEHFIFTGAKTGKNRYYDLVEEVRNIRKELLKKIIVEYEGEVWCISKHLLATCMRLMEVGSKQLSLDNKAEAYDFYQKAYDVYSLFWGLALKAIDVGKITAIDEKALDKHDKEKRGMLGSLGKLVKKAIDCCLE